MKDRHWRLSVGCCCLWFLAWGLLWVGDVGIETDEALFSSGVYGPFASNFVIRAAGMDFPIMTMSYVGTVKSWLYRPILMLWDPSPVVLRVPVVVLGAVSIWLFGCLLKNCVNATAAVFGAVLLSSDPLYLLTIRWDWGPVAIQHLCLIGALALFARYHKNPQYWSLAAAFALLGLGLWDKAIFIWLLAAMGASAICVFPRIVFKHLNVRTVVLGIASFALGAAPLLIFNIREHWITFRSNAHLSSSDVVGKAKLLKETLQGGGLYGSIVREDWDGPERPDLTELQHLLVSFNSKVGKPRATLQLALFGASLVSLPFLWKIQSHRRPMLFALLFIVVGWCLMAFTKDVGGSTHHVILLWPMPQFFIATVLSAFASARWRFVRRAVVICCAVVCMSGCAVLTTYYAQQIRNGGNWAWTDAFFALSDAVTVKNSPRLCVLDWGFWDNLRFMHKGTLKLEQPPSLGTRDEKTKLLKLFADSGMFFVCHTKGNEGFPGQAAAILQFAEQYGYERRDLQSFRDRNGRDVIELFSLRRSSFGTSPL